MNALRMSLMKPGRFMQIRRNADQKVLNKQTFFQKDSHLHGADNPTYLKEGADKMVMMGVYAFSAFTVLGVARGMYNMSHGINKE
eukprot:g5042.t1